MTEPTDLTELDFDASEELLSEQDEADLNALNEPVELQHTLFEMWTSVLSNIEASLATRMHPQIALNILGSWNRLTFADLPAYHDLYHFRQIELRDILAEVIAENPGCLTFTGERGTETSDAVGNHDAYLELFYRWRARIQQWEHEFDFASPIAGVDVATIADVAAFFIGNQGLVTHFDQIGLQYDQAEAEAIEARLAEAKLKLVNGE